jgi:hypothetical protein
MDVNVVGSIFVDGGVAGKTIVKTVTSKGVTKTLFELPAKYEGTLIRMGQLNYVNKGSSELGILATSQYIKKGSPEGVLRVGFGWTKKDAVKNVVQDEAIEHGVGGIIIDPYREDIDYVGHRAYGDIRDYLIGV